MSSNVPSYPPPRERFATGPSSREAYAPPYPQRPYDLQEVERFHEPSNYANFYPTPQQHGRVPPGGSNGTAVSTRPPNNEGSSLNHYEMGGPMNNQYRMRSMSPSEYGGYPGIMMGPGGPPIPSNGFNLGNPPPYAVGPGHYMPQQYPGGGPYLPRDQLSPAHNGVPSSNNKPKQTRKYHKLDKSEPETAKRQKHEFDDDVILSELDKESRQKLSTETLMNEVGPILGGDANQVKDDFEAKFINNIATVLGKHKRGRPSLKEKAKSKEERDLELAKKIRVEVYGTTGEPILGEEKSKLNRIEDSQHTEGNELDYTNGTMTQAYENESVASEGTKYDEVLSTGHLGGMNSQSPGKMSNVYFPQDYDGGQSYANQTSMKSSLDKLAANRKKAALSARKKRAEHKEFVMKLTEQVILLRKQNNELETKLKELETENQELKILVRKDDLSGDNPKEEGNTTIPDSVVKEVEEEKEQSVEDPVVKETEEEVDLNNNQDAEDKKADSQQIDSNKDEFVPSPEAA